MIARRRLIYYPRKFVWSLSKKVKFASPKPKRLEEDRFVLNEETGEYERKKMREVPDYKPKQKDFFRVKYFAEIRVAEIVTGGASLRLLSLLKGYCRSGNRVYATKRGVEKKLNVAKRTVQLAFKELQEKNIIAQDPDDPNFWFIDPNICWVGFTEDWGQAYAHYTQLIGGAQPFVVKEINDEGRLRLIK